MLTMFIKNIKLCIENKYLEYFYSSFIQIEKFFEIVTLIILCHLNK